MLVHLSPLPGVVVVDIIAIASFQLGSVWWIDRAMTESNNEVRVRVELTNWDQYNRMCLNNRRLRFLDEHSRPGYQEVA